LTSFRESVVSAVSLPRAWRYVRRLPKGGVLFGRVLGAMAPYSQSMGPEIIELKPGFAQVRIRDRKAVRNHLNSLHAMALANLAEMTTGLAVLSAVAPRHRAILVHFEISYQKKARGLVTATAEFGGLESSVGPLYEVTAFLRNQDNVTVATAAGRWKVSPNSKAR
jgi:acyl-coenzyme A thioesterase PaaI-like protein